VILASSFSFLEVFWTILIFFGFVFWLMILFNVIGDIFARHDITGWGKVLWLIAIILLPYLGVFIYLIVEHEGLVQRSVQQQKMAQSQFDQYVQSVSARGDPAEQIAKAKSLLDRGAITQAEFEQIKQKALATA
jgi:hypothetical protein